MTEETLLMLGRQSMWITLQLAGPMLLFGLVAGVTISILQAVTQIQEATLSFIPKILGVGAALLLFMPWMIQKIVHFTTFVLGDFRYFIR